MQLSGLIAKVSKYADRITSLYHFILSFSKEKLYKGFVSCIRGDPLLLITFFKVDLSACKILLLDDFIALLMILLHFYRWFI